MPKHTLQTIQKRIDALLSQANRLKRKRMPALRQIVNLAKAHSFSIEEIRAALPGGGKRKETTAKKRTRKHSRKYAVKYRNPKTRETWSGQGSPARWLVDAEKAGRKRTDFLVRKAA